MSEDNLLIGSSDSSERRRKPSFTKTADEKPSSSTYAHSRSRSEEDASSNDVIEVTSQKLNTLTNSSRSTSSNSALSRNGGAGKGTLSCSRSSSMESLLDDFSHKAKSMFAQLDQSNTGFIDLEELALCCQELSPDELTSLFGELDRDGDGRIGLSDFKEGFRSISRTLQQKGQERRRSRMLSISDIPPLPERLTKGDNKLGDSMEEDESRMQICQTLSEGLSSLTCQDQVCELYQVIHLECPHLLEHFEMIISDVIKDFQIHRMELDKLEKLFMKEKETHEQNVRQLEDELETQIQNVEENVRRKEGHRLETIYLEKINQKKELINSLEHKLKSFVESAERHTVLTQIENDSVIGQLRADLESLQTENRFLKSELSEAETQLALAKSDMLSLKLEHDDKCKDLSRKKIVLSEFYDEQEKLSNQVQLLHEANRKLHDTNDDLRCAIEVNTPQSTPIMPVGHAPSFLTVSGPPSRKQSLQHNYNRSVSALEENLAVCDPAKKVQSASVISELDSPVGDIDSGLSTLRDVTELESEMECDNRSARVNSKFKSNFFVDHSQCDSAKESEMETEQDSTLRYRSLANRPSTLALTDSVDGSMNHHASDSDQSRKRNNQRSRRNSPQRRLHKSKQGRSTTSRSRSNNLKLSRNDENVHSKATIHTTNESIVEGSSNDVQHKSLITTPVGQPERMFRVVLAGDAAVGKTSFIMRLCKNKFTTNVSTTLGVDFSNKTVEVDNRIFALQLWDTAGQERFRSIAHSYFRRADGVLLLYDCTYERSFINVREWIENIQDCSRRNIPIMIVANKTDLRNQYEREGRKVISTQQGKRLAQENEALFIETSAKDASNMGECIMELARLLKTTEDFEVTNAHVQLMQESKKETSGCCIKF